MIFAVCVPLIVAAVLVFITSSLIHMVFKWHQSDYAELGNEDEVRAALRKAAPGQYVIPFCKDMKDAGAPQMQAKFAEGPVGMLLLRPSGLPKIGKNLAQWFALNLLVAATAACVAASSLGAGANAHRVFHVTALVSFIAYAAGSISDAIWKGLPWKSVFKDVLDALIFGLVSGAAFAWLWPQ